MNQIVLKEDVMTANPARKVKLGVSGINKTFRIRNANGQPSSLLPVLRDIRFDVYENEVVSLIGESGCGKTTLLRTIQGLVRHDSGTISVDGKEVKGAGRDRGFVFQQPSLLPWRTARENVEFGLELQGMAAGERAERAKRLLALVGLGHAAEQFPHQLSGGMQQRIGLARALAIDPTILLMDEPFSALDAQTREVLQKELLRIQAETRKTILFVTHDLDEAIYLSNRIIVLGAKPGRVKEVITLPFSGERPELPVMRGDPEFQAIRTRIWDLIRSTPANS
ncbi:NitT/TauT family transport system ATP-binding protein [Rhizobium azooxidifex]|uniref:NitT/TauT family transport system ATP-binding protein n=1 Tax=Mycoplana azooxidifex TaxID=1636188 RepID=A0A7W6GJI6_9HYPH|nr:ABC transporter ATP-binding protein [Mycoplana azooxidifex]MBB3977615.1 NitT/TauT family transport system ATP-binding protein [Mycoplana azooxidifex]